MRVGTALWNSG